MKCLIKNRIKDLQSPKKFAKLEKNSHIKIQACAKC